MQSAIRFGALGPGLMRKPSSTWIPPSTYVNTSNSRGRRTPARSGTGGPRTPDPLLAKYAQTVGYRRSPGLAATASPPESARVGSCCGRDWWSALTVPTRAAQATWCVARVWSAGERPAAFKIVSPKRASWPTPRQARWPHSPLPVNDPNTWPVVAREPVRVAARQWSRQLVPRICPSRPSTRRGTVL